MLRVLGFLLALIAPLAAYAQSSSINTALPANGLPYSSSVIRGNFGDASSDLNRLFTANAGASQPFTCNQSSYLGNVWINDTSNPYSFNVCDGAQWVTAYFLDATNHLVTPPTGRGVCQSIVAATTTDLGSVPQSCITVTGNSSVSISSFGTSAKAGDIKLVTFSGSNTVVYNATSLILPAATNLSTGSGTVLIAEALGSGNWQVFVAQGSGGGSSVTSFNGRTGVVVPATNDYNFNQLAGTIAYAQNVAPLQSGTANYIPYWASSSTLANGSPTAIAQTVLPAIAAPGTGTNISCSLVTAGTSITCTNDAFVVCSALTSANCAEIGSLNQAFAGNTTGVNGMDTGSLPSSGWVAIYEIFNPATQSVGLLGFNCSSSCPTLYAGAHMPSGYTMNALLTVLPTNGTPAIVPGYVRGKLFQYQTPSAPLNGSSTNEGSLTLLSLSGAVPPNAILCSGHVKVVTGAGYGGGGWLVDLASDTTAVVYQVGQFVAASSVVTGVAPYSNLALPTSQTMYYATTTISANALVSITVANYTIP